MLDREATCRADKRFANRLRNAKMRFPNACIEDVDLHRQLGASTAARSCLSPKATGSRPKEQIILTSQTGTGKDLVGLRLRPPGRTPGSFRVSYVRMPRLFEDMAMARLDGRFPRLVDKLARVQLLVLDDWGTHGLTDQQRLDLLELFEERYQRQIHDHHRAAAGLRLASDDRRAHHR